ncbi:hypothetical protein IT774_05910 [Salinimonas marina]|uniref:AAA family ATPase n=1 Tax=Salinimonas marina TaxID=2785918 RepID=A0A7S9DZA4_9ALTE|nr:FimV/HubP family polar landmark protein [Salinimonas marina]QPG06683.1 hypothetical protein IT774_05910 [Salinimonas marina]
MKLHLSGLLVLLCLSTFPAADISAQERQTQLRGPKDATNQYSGAVYGPIDEQDTLWRIAQRYRQDSSLSMYQVMQAIYELNPDAFEQQNRNLLVEGATLRLPSRRYTARIDVEEARTNAEADDKQYAELLKQPASASNNIKPPEPLVKKSDLSDTRTAIEQQISRLDEQQIQQFDELRQQFAASLNNVQQMLDENRKLYERVEQVNTDLMSLRQQVEGDVQSQMDEQLALQRELLAMVKEDQAARQAEQQSSIISTLTQPVSLIIGSGILTLLLAGGLAAWFLRKRDHEAPEMPPQSEVEAAPPTVTEDIASSISTDIEDDTPELSDDELFNDDELLDDVLSSELEDTLDAELDNFSDDMLVPDENEQIFEDGDSELGQGDLDSLFDDEDMDTVELTEEVDDIDSAGQNDVISEEPEEVPEKKPSEQPVSEDDFTVNTDDAALANELDTDDNSLPPITAASVGNDEQPEISIDELLEAEQAKGEKSFVTDNDTVDDAMLGKLDDEINQQNAELDRLADGILEEIDQLEQMGGLPTAEDIEREELENSGPSPQGIQDLDAFADDLDDIELDDVDNAENFADPLSDELIAQLQAENDFEEDELLEPQPAAGFDDPLSDELLAELNAEQDDSEEQLDALSEELLAELDTDHAAGDPSDIEASPGEQAGQDEELTDDLLAELEAGISAGEEQPSAGVGSSPSESVSTEADVADDDIDALLDSVTEDDAESDSESEPEQAPESAPESASESDISEADVATDDIDALLDSVAEDNAESDSESNTESAPESAPESASESDRADADVATDDIDALLDSVAEDNAESDSESAPESAPESASESFSSEADVAADDIDALLDSVAEDNAESDSESDTESAPESASESDSSDTDVAADDIDALLDSVAEDNAESDSESASESAPESASESDSDDADVADDDIDALLDSVAEDDAEPDSESEPEPAPESASKSDSSDTDAADDDIDALLASVAEDNAESDSESAPAEVNTDDEASASADESAGPVMADAEIEALLDSLESDEAQPDLEHADSESQQSGEIPEVSPFESTADDTTAQDKVSEEGATDAETSQSEPVSEQPAGPAMADAEIEALLDSLGGDEAESDSAADTMSDSDTVPAATEESAAEHELEQTARSGDEFTHEDEQTPEEGITERETPEAETAGQFTDEDMSDEDIDALFDSMMEDPSPQSTAAPNQDLASEDAAENLLSEIEQPEESEDHFAGEPSLEFEDEASDAAPADLATAAESTPASEPRSDVQVDPLDSALAEFDQQMMEDIPSFTDGAPQAESEFDDSILGDFDDAPEFKLEQEEEGVIPSVKPAQGDINELADVPGLDDWLSGTKGTDKDIFDELESSDFDALLDDMGGESSEPTTDASPSNLPDETERRFKEQNPDLDLSALLNEPDDLTPSKNEETDYLTVESLLDESLQDEGNQFEEMPLDLDVSLSDYSGISDDADIIDIDKDAGQNANLDLARVYLEMDDMPTARELLEDVIKNGSEEQQKEASDLLATLV